MSLNGQIVFWTDADLGHPQETIDMIVELSGVSEADFVERTKSESRDWDIFLKETGLAAGDEASLGGGIRPYWVEIEEHIEDIPSPVPASELSRYYVDGTSLHAGLEKARHADLIVGAVKGFPERVRGDFEPWNFVVRCGYHDLFECVENDAGTYFGRASLSISFWGYGLPEDWDEFRRMAEADEVIQAVRREYEEILGPLSQVCYWDT